MSRFQARILDGPHLFARDEVTLAIRDDDRRAFILNDGTWQSVEDGMQAPANHGLIIPAAAIEAIAVAIQEWQGHTSHADTEARVLREWLAVEQRRVDSFLANPSSDTR